MHRFHPRLQTWHRALSALSVRRPSSFVLRPASVVFIASFALITHLAARPSDSLLATRYSETTFKTPVANPFEARIGSMVQVDDERLRLDIGASVDIAEVANDSSIGRIMIGTDFMTWTRLRSENNFKFPVETVDYWFGVNGQWLMADGLWSMRMRIAHISSHLVDGLANDSAMLVPAPFVYSREFVEVLVAREIGAGLRPYAGLTYVWATQPDSPDPIIPEAGFDLRVPISGHWHLLAGYDFKLIGINGTYAATNAAQAGIFYDLWQGRGLMLSGYGYSGRSMHGMFFTDYDAYVGIGFQVLW